MVASHDDLMKWLSNDSSNVDKFIKSLDKILNKRVVLIVDEDSNTLITGFMASKKQRRVSR